MGQKGHGCHQHGGEEPAAPEAPAGGEECPESDLRSFGGRFGLEFRFVVHLLG